MRKTLVRLGMGVAATAAALALMAPAAHATEGSDHDDGASTSTKPEGTLLDAWANRDMDIGTFGSAMAQAGDSRIDGIGGILDGWANRDKDISFGAAMAAATGSRMGGFGAGSILDGWGNRDMDIGAFAMGSAMAQALSETTWRNADTPNGGETLGSDW